MKYQLVLQFPADIADFDELTNLEQALDDTLSAIADVDGHDFGLGEFNIFIFTDDPVKAFGLAEQIIEARKPIQQFKAAYREIEGEKYTILWPLGLQYFAVA